MSEKKEENSTVQSNGINSVNEVSDVKGSVKQKRRSIISRIRSTFIDKFEDLFEFIGLQIGKHPLVFIICTTLLVSLCLVGNLFTPEDNEENMQWVPFNARYRDDQKIVTKYFPSNARFQQFIAEAPNVLTADVIKVLWEIDLKIRNSNSSGKAFTDLCLEAAPGVCLSSSIFQLWFYDPAVIDALNDSEILSKVNSETIDPGVNQKIDVKQYIGGVVENDEKIVSAKSLVFTYFVKDEKSQSKKEVIENWEQEYLDILANDSIPDLKFYRTSARSFGDEGGGEIRKDLVNLLIGYCLVVVYLIVILGEFNCVDQKIYVAIAGLITIILSYFVSYGIAGYLKIGTSNLHSILPFLLLGIGVDDLFIIAIEWKNLESDTTSPVDVKISKMLRHAGVSIVVTSVTDIVAFGVGATTIIPALRSFCIYASIGILSVFTLTIVFFVPIFALDSRRGKAKLNACCCCYNHGEAYEPNKCSKMSLLSLFLKKIYSPVVFFRPLQIFIIAAALAFQGITLYGSIKLEQEFDIRWFVPTDSYLTEYFEASDRFYPSSGITASIYFIDVDYYQDKSNISAIYDGIDHLNYVRDNSSIFWYASFIDWMRNPTKFNATEQTYISNDWPNSEENFMYFVNKFLLQASKFRGSVKIISNEIKASKMDFQHVLLYSSKTEITALDEVYNAIDSLPLRQGIAFAFSSSYSGIEMNRQIQEELYRNLLMAFVCVFIICFILLADILMCIYVSVCVIMTLISVCGCMYFWGLTIDTVSSVILIIAIGLSVDYSAHIGHRFLTEQGNRKERAENALYFIGPAVISGAASTFLSFILLAPSTSYVFSVFFKVFLLVVSFGLMNGLLILPVILSLIGPSSYKAEEKTQTENSDNTAPTMQEKFDNL